MTKNDITRKTLRVFRDFISVFLAVLAVFLLSRCYEWGILAWQHGVQPLNASYLLSGILRDFQISILATFPLWFVFKGLKIFFPNLSTKIMAGIITAMGIGNAMLITYFSATLVPLGPEFWAYTWTEMTNTVIASEFLSIWSFLFMVAAATGCYLAIQYLLRITTDSFRKPIVLGAPILATCTFALIIWIPTSGSSPEYAANKFAYFASSAIQANGLWEDKTYPSSDQIDQEYPFLHSATNKDVLGSFFHPTDSPPNIVFLLVESLGGEFVGRSGQWTGFAPFIDSLAQQGLYWENGISLSGRTFGAIPSLLGSLPPGKHGFMDLGPSYPTHQTLISLLDKRGYRTTFFSGYNTYFDNLDYFLEYQGIDFILNKQKIADQKTSGQSTEQNYWGFDDKTMFNIASGILDTTTASRRLEIYHTLQSHSPFTVPDTRKYQEKFNRRLHNLDIPTSRKEAYRRYQSELTTLLYTDDALQDFMHEYRKRDEYKNTIFIITGDHWLIPVPQTTQISRYHVPIIIYSPLLKKSVHFNSVNTHANVVPSLVSYLEQNTKLAMPDSVHWIGSPMDTARAPRNIHSLPLMKNKNQMTDYLHKKYYLSDDRLYSLKKDLILADISNSDVKEKLQQKLSSFKAKNRYAINNDRLYPGSTKPDIPKKYDFVSRYDTLFQRIDSLNLNPDQQFQMARQHAFDGNYEIARAICRRLLMRYPDYHDIRLLQGRTYAWEGDYKQARQIFNEMLQRDSTYYDTYNALADTEYWAGNYQRALEVINKGLDHHPNHEQFLEKKIRILSALNRYSTAQEVFYSLQTHHPENNKLQELKKYITK